MANIKTVPNQKVVKINKEECNKTHLYAAINLAAIEAAAQDLEAGAFKLWIFFAKNQNDYTFALSSKEVKDCFGMGIKQYNTAIEKLIEKGYLVAEEGSNQYIFNEMPVITKGNNDSEKNHVITKGNNDVMIKGNNALLQKDIRNITYNTYYTTDGESLHSSQEPQVIEVVGAQEPIKRRKEKLEAFRF